MEKLHTRAPLSSSTSWTNSRKVKDFALERKQKLFDDHSEKGKRQFIPDIASEKGGEEQENRPNVISPLVLRARTF